MKLGLELELEQTLRVSLVSRAAFATVTVKEKQRNLDRLKDSDNHIHQ